MFNYKAFNLHFITLFECPELIKIDENSGLEKIEVKYSNFPDKLENNLIDKNSYYQSNENEILLKIKDVGIFLIRNKNEILINKDENVSMDTLRLFLFGSVIGALLHQRSAFPLHSSAISTKKGVMLFCGDSGAGKSTTLQAFLKKGYKKLSDDTIALYYDEKEKKICCIPSYPQSKLWKNTADIFNHNTNNLRQIHKELNKYALPTHDNFDDRIQPLYKIFELNISDHEELKIEKIENKMEKLNIIIKNTYRYYYLDKLPQRKDHFTLASEIANKIEIYKVFRPKNKNSLEKLIQNIEECILI